MADLVQTPANVVPVGRPALVPGLAIAGEALTAGMPVYKKLSDQRWYMGDCDTATVPLTGDTVPPECDVKGFALNDAAVGQTLRIQSGGDINLGAALAPGKGYALSHTAGKVCPIDDLLAGQTPPHNLVILGYAREAGVFAVKIDNTRVVL